MTDREALRAMIRYAQHDAAGLDLSFTAHLLNLAAESIGTKAGDIQEFPATNQPDDQGKDMPQDEKHTPSREDRLQ